MKPKPVLTGSGITTENIRKVYEKANGFIVGSHFKKGGRGDNFVESRRVRRFMETVKRLSGKA